MALRLLATRFRLVLERDAKGNPTSWRDLVAGDVFEAEVGDADRLVRARAAEDADAAPDTSSDEVPPADDAPASVETVEDAPASDAVARPHRNDNRDAWLDYAVSQGADREVAEEFTKAELIAEFGK